MLDRFLNGLIFGAGFAIAVLVVAAPAYLIINATVVHDGEIVSAAPDVKDTDRYLGSDGSYFGGFEDDENKVLSAGPGEIVGTASVNGEPLGGLKLRLALNGSVMSQWATTDAGGRYAVAVPYGRYRIDGYEVDRETANVVLAGKINNPRNAYSSGVLSVSEGAPGRGLNLRFVDPVEMDMQKTAFSADEEIVVHWKPYPGATRYSVQIYEKPNPHSHTGHEPVFPWSGRPTVTEPSFSLEDYDVELKPGYFYVVEVEAWGEGGAGMVLSETPRRLSGFDFEVTE